MKIIANQTKTRYNEKGKLIAKIVKGDTYQSSSKVFKIFGNSCFDKAPRLSSTRELYTPDEEWLLAGLICDGNTPNQVKVEFRKVYDTHSDHSLDWQYRQAVNVATKGAKGVSHVTRSFVEKLIALEPSVFG